MRIALLSALMVLSISCMESGPEHVGDYLRMSQGEIESELSVTLSEWQPWPLAHGYSYATDREHTVSFYDHDWHLTVYRCDSLIDGITLRSPYPGWEEFQRLIPLIASDENAQYDDQGIGWVQDGGNLIHFYAEPREGMFLTVTDHHMSATYESTLMIEDLQFLNDATEPWTQGM